MPGLLLPPRLASCPTCRARRLCPSARVSQADRNLRSHGGITLSSTNGQFAGSCRDPRDGGAAGCRRRNRASRASQTMERERPSPATEPPSPRKKGISRDRLRRILESQIDSVGGATGAYVFDADANSNRLIYSDSGSNSRILASNSKLFTDRRLPRAVRRERLKTRVFERGKRTGGRERTLKGSLVLVGDGIRRWRVRASPRLETCRYEPRAACQGGEGRRHHAVKGKIVADPTSSTGRLGSDAGRHSGSRRPPHPFGALIQPRHSRAVAMRRARHGMPARS